MKRSMIAIFVSTMFVAAAAAQPKPADQWLRRPVDEKTFKSYLDFFAYERQLPFDTRVTKTENDQGLRREWLSFESTRGTRVTAILTEQPGVAEGKKPAIIVLHGGVARGKESAGYFVALFARAGFSVLAIDMP